MTALHEEIRLDATSAGAAAALPAALAAGLVATAARLTVAADPFSDIAFDLDPVVREVDELRATLLELAVEDAAACGRVREISLRVSELAADLVERGDPHVAAEARVAVLFAAASAEAAAAVADSLPGA